LAIGEGIHRRKIEVNLQLDGGSELEVTLGVVLGRIEEGVVDDGTSGVVLIISLVVVVGVSKGVVVTGSSVVEESNVVELEMVVELVELKVVVVESSEDMVAIPQGCYAIEYCQERFPQHRPWKQRRGPSAAMVAASTTRQ
jgi:hypothetical protein